MAKWGEGDPRWIVEERADAHNVNNWHWRESDASQWSKTKFKDLFTGLRIEDENAGTCVITEVTATGEASVSNRKKKIICFYEWDIKMKWRGNAKGDDATYKGELLVPNMSEEYEPDEVDVEIKVKKENKEKQELMLLMKTLGVAMVRSKLQVYLDLLRTEYATQIILPPKDAKTESKSTPAQPPSTSTNPIKKEMDKLAVSDTANGKKNMGIKIATRKLTMTETFMTTVDELYMTLTLKDRISAWSRSEVKKDADVGEILCLFDKNVELEYVQLVRDTKIVMKWRMKSWLDGHYSTVTMNLTQTPDGAKISLEQTGVPENSIEATTTGWKRYYWNAIKMTFGFGTRIM